MLQTTEFGKGRGLALTALCCALLLFTGCEGGGGGGDHDTDPAPLSLNQAGFQGGSTYAYGHNSIPNVPISNAPADTDFSRWAMLHDGSTYRLYFFKRGSMSIYQFGFDGSTYDFGHDSIREIAITGTPPDADPSSFKMLHDGRDYRLYMRGFDESELHQFAFNGSGYEYGFRSIDVIDTTGAPADVDFSRWAMLFDGSVYRQYVARLGSDDAIYQFGFDGRSYAYGHRSISNLSIVGMPANSDTSSFSMLHDGLDFRFYHLAR